MNDKPLYRHVVPIVYTTRLEDMGVLKNVNKLSKKKFEDTIQLIIAKSKPCCKNIRSGSKISKPQYSYKSLKLTRKRDIDTKILQEIISYNTNKGEYRDGQFITIKSNYRIKDEPEKSEKHTNKLRSLLALCKPLRVVLEDIRKKPKKETVKERTVDEDNVIYVLSNSDEVSDTEAVNFSYYTIKNINEYKNLIMNRDLRNSVIVFYNPILDELDSYEIDDKYAVADSVNAKSAQTYKSRKKRNSSVYNIVVCCSKERHLYISLLESIEKYRNIAKFMYTRKPFQQSVCNCLDVNISTNEQNFPCLETDSPNNMCDPLEIKSITLSDYQHTSNVLQYGRPVKASNLISNALVFKKDSKWKRSEEKLNSKCNKKSPKQMVCNVSLTLRKGDVTEIYELGEEDQIYSKLITNYKNQSSWLLKTLGTARTSILPVYNKSWDRESQINYIKHNMKISVSNYLRFPISKDYKVYVNKNDFQEKKSICDIYSYRIEYIRYFVGAKNKHTAVLAITPKEFSPKKSVHENKQISQFLLSMPMIDIAKNSTIPSKVPVQVDNRQSKLYLLLAKKPEMDKDALYSQCIDSSIKNILYRFRDVNLTINSEGKVSASLNAPLSTLSPTEVKILSAILKRAQNQVDELGLKNRKLNKDTIKLLQPTCLKIRHCSNDSNKRLLNSSAIKKCTTHNTNANEGTKKAVEGNQNRQNISDIFNSKTKKNTGHPYMPDKSKDFLIFSEWVSKKKIWYGKKFKSFLENKIEFNTPKIVSVFSLQPVGNQDGRLYPEISEDLERHRNVTNITNVKREIIDECTETIQQKMCFLATEIKSTLQMEDKKVTKRGQKRILGSSDDAASFKIKRNNKESGKS